MNEFHCHYQVYGYRLCSNLPLPELSRAEFTTRDMSFRVVPAEGDVSLLGPGAQLLSRRETSLGCDLSMYDTGPGFLLRWEEFCDYLVAKDGRHIQCQLAEGQDYTWAQSTLYNMILSFALHLKNVSNFHASGVALPGGVVAFLADPGSGKSTMATAFALAGHPFLTDDVLTVQRDAWQYVAHPGFPSVSLSAQSMTGLLGPMERTVPLPPEGEKERVGVKGQGLFFSGDPKPLLAMFLLERGDEQAPIAIEALPREEAVLGLLKHTNNLPLLPLEVLRRHLNFVTDLTGAVPVCRLRYPSSYASTPQVVAAVLEQQQQLASSTETN